MSKILIISSEDDQTTNLVLDWLIHYKQDYLRINDTTNLEVSSFKLEINNIDFTLKNDKINFSFSKIKSIWYRRGLLNISTKTIKSKFSNHKFVNNLSIYLSQEYLHFNYAILDLLYSKVHINRSNDVHTNKISNLYKAFQCGLDVPDSIITKYKSDVVTFKEKHVEIISKAIHYGNYIENNLSIGCYTNELTNELIEELPNEFWPSLVQVKLDKLFELRIFYLHGEFFASAIFSQNDKKTQVDFRKYNYEKPNRTPPFELPISIKQKLILFMESINMNCGSIDIVVTKDLKYYFLEVNPVGQFQQVSYPCNYFLEEKVAQFLIQNENRNN